MLGILGAIASIAIGVYCLIIGYLAVVGGLKALVHKDQ